MPPEIDPDAPDDDTDDPKPPGPPKETDWKAEAEKYKSLARKHEDRAKANNSAAKELATLREQGMTDIERQVEEAKKATRTETLAEVGQSRAGDAIRFSIGDRLKDDEVDSLLDDLNLGRFLTEDGQVDKAKVATYVARVAPAAPGRQFPDLGQGAGNGNRSGGKSFLADAIRKRNG